VNSGNNVLDQALFGYDDGHKLIASSIRLPSELASDLTVLSDLAPGVRFQGSSGYWTGVPVPSIKKYALMRTWPAPEMPRPGCVWSHVIFLDTELLGEIEDLYSLTALFKRPGAAYDKAAYSAELTARSDDAEVPSSSDFSRAAEVLTAVYDSATPPTLTSLPGELDGLIFQVWSQQWPRLRRNFRFQTAVLDRNPPTRTARFDLRLARFEDEDDVRRQDVSQVRTFDWFQTALGDLPAKRTTPLRAFLRTYGSDVTRPRASFIPLVTVFAEATAGRLEGSDAHEVLALVAEAFPTKPDGLSLKRALISGTDSGLNPDPIALLNFLLTSPYEQSFPKVPERTVKELRTYWPERREELLRLATDALSAQSEIAPSVVEAVAASIPDEHVWDATADNEPLLYVTLQKRPDLLVSPKLAKVDGYAIAALLALVPPDAPYAGEIVANLIGRDDPPPVEWAFQKFPIAAIEAVVSQVGLGKPFAPVWVRKLTDFPDLVLTGRTLSKLQNTFSLLQVLRAFGVGSEAISNAGSEPWAIAIRTATRNLSEEDSLLLNASLLRIALSSEGAGREELLAGVFDDVYEWATKSFLPSKVRDILDPVLPQLKYKNYDIPLRLLGAVGIVYAFGDFDPKTFHHVSQSKRTMKDLKEVISSAPEGRRFLKAV
jgi:hypothetical protein